MTAVHARQADRRAAFASESLHAELGDPPDTQPIRLTDHPARGIGVLEAVDDAFAMRAALTDDDVERIEEGGTGPTIPLLRRLAAALNADVRLSGGHDLGSVWFETHAA